MTYCNCTFRLHASTCNSISFFLSSCFSFGVPLTQTLFAHFSLIALQSSQARLHNSATGWRWVHSAKSVYPAQVLSSSVTLPNSKIRGGEMSATWWKKERIKLESKEFKQESEQGETERKWRSGGSCQKCLARPFYLETNVGSSSAQNSVQSVILLLFHFCHMFV